MISRTFESQRQNIIKRIEANQFYDISDATEDDYQALRALEGVMLGLLQFEPCNRISAREAASMIQWTDTWQEDNEQEDHQDDQHPREEIISNADPEAEGETEKGE
jgi:hypothetical protein